MIRVTVDSIRVSLLTQHRVVVLRESDSRRYLPIWIGPFEADAIALALQGHEPQRPMTHDLLKSVFSELGAAIIHILVSDIHDSTFYARIVVEQTDDATGITVRPNPHASLYVHILEHTEPAPSPRDADVIRHGVETFVQMLPLLFQDAVRAQWLAAGGELARSSGPELRALAVRLAQDVEALVAEAEGAKPPKGRAGAR